MAGSNTGANAGGGAIYGLGIFGAWVYFWQQAEDFLGDPAALLPGHLLAGVDGLRGLRRPPRLSAGGRRPDRGRSAVDWLFRDRETGEITVAQFPELPLWIFLGTVVARLVRAGEPRCFHGAAGRGPGRVAGGGLYQQQAGALIRGGDRSGWPVVSSWSSASSASFAQRPHSQPGRSGRTLDPPRSSSPLEATGQDVRLG